MKYDAKEDLPIINWFPGHMTKARKIIAENLHLVDVVVELLDARAPYSSSNPLLREMMAGKPRLVVLNKMDLADSAITQEWLQYYKKQGIAVTAVDAISGQGIKKFIQAAGDLAKYKTERLAGKGVRARAARLMILGIPNVGKSSLINRLAGANKTRTANKPGVTRAKQWINIGKGLELLDTPGILWPKFLDMSVGVRLAFLGTINDEVYDREKAVYLLTEMLLSDHPQAVCARYNLLQENITDTAVFLEALGKKRGCLLKGGILDMEKVQNILLTEFRAGKLGRITLEAPSDISAGRVN